MGCGFAFMEAFKQHQIVDLLFLKMIVLKRKTSLQNSKFHTTQMLFISALAWARYNGESGPYLRGQSVAPNTVRIANMLSAHAIYYRSKRYTDACKVALDSLSIPTKTITILGLQISWATTMYIATKSQLCTSQANHKQLKSHCHKEKKNDSKTLFLLL